MKYEYNSFTIVAPLEYEYLFSESPRENYEKVLTQYSRDEIVHLAVNLNQDFSFQPAEKICQLLAQYDLRRMDIHWKLKKFMRNDAYPNTKYVVTFKTTPLELLRKAFSIPYSRFNHKNKTSDINNLRFQTLKLVTQINEEMMRLEKIENLEGDFSKLSYVNNASYNDILYFKCEDEFLFQTTLAIKFFRFLEKDSQYGSLLYGFYKNYQITDWKEYIRAIWSLLALSRRKERIIPKNEIDGMDKLLQHFLEVLCIRTDRDTIPYSSSRENKDGNDNYRIFRDKPLFKLENGDYAIHCIPLLVDKMYRSLFFDFIEIGKSLGMTFQKVSNIFTSAFMEQTLFRELMKECASPARYLSMDEEMMKNVHKEVNNELGTPDYFIKGENSILLFELKDFHLKGQSKEQRDYRIIEAIENKVVLKTHQSNNPLEKPKRIGCGQIAGHLANIRKGDFPWCKSLKGSERIYPILIIADNKLLARGLASILQKDFRERLKEESVDANYEKPLILMSPLTLLKYDNLFRRDGFEMYFEEYYKQLAQTPSNIEEANNQIKSFEEYMSENHPLSYEAWMSKIHKYISSGYPFSDSSHTRSRSRLSVSTFRGTTE